MKQDDTDNRNHKPSQEPRNVWLEYRRRKNEELKKELRSDRPEPTVAPPAPEPAGAGTHTED